MVLHKIAIEFDRKPFAVVCNLSWYKMKNNTHFDPSSGKCIEGTE